MGPLIEFSDGDVKTDVTVYESSNDRTVSHKRMKVSVTQLHGDRRSVEFQEIYSWVRRGAYDQLGSKPEPDERLERGRR